MPGRVQFPDRWQTPLKTISGPYLSSPDELESICMRFRKRRSRLTTSQQFQDACTTHLPSILRFCAPPRQHRHPDTPGHQNRSCTLELNEQIKVKARKCCLHFFCSHGRVRWQDHADVVKLCLSFKTSIQTPPNSSGVLRSEPKLVSECQNLESRFSASW